MCGKGSQQSTSTTVNTPPENVLRQYDKVVAKANDVAELPYQAYGGELTADWNPQQADALRQFQSTFGDLAYTQGLNRGTATNMGSVAAEMRGLSNAGQPYYDMGTAAINNGARAIEAGDIDHYMSPYTSQVVDATRANIRENDRIQQNDLVDQAISVGAWGGDRSGVARAELARNQNLASGQTMAGIYDRGYQTSLGAAQADRARSLQAGSQYMGMGQAVQGGKLNALNASLGAYGQQANANSMMNSTSAAALQAASGQLAGGTAKQTSEQNALNALYQQFQNQISFPYEQTGWLGNLSMGIGNSSGGTSTTTSTSPKPFFSDRRIKTGVQQVGETYTGEPIYRYRIKGQPGYQIGLMAQDVLKSNPDAVSEHGGVLAVDYKAATEDDAKRGKFAMGGGLVGNDSYPGSRRNQPAIQSSGLVPTFQAQSRASTIPTAPKPQQMGEQGGPLEKAVVGAGQKALMDPKGTMAKIQSWMPGSGGAIPGAASTVAPAAPAAAETVGAGMGIPAGGGIGGAGGAADLVGSAAGIGGAAEMAPIGMAGMGEAAASAGAVGSGLAEAGIAAAGLDAAAAATAAAAGTAGSEALLMLLPFLSDRRAKEDAEPIGKLYDGQTVERFRYKGQDGHQIGLMAQDVEQAHPEAVSDHGGMKAVDYHAATQDAAERSGFAGGGSVGTFYGFMPPGDEFIPEIEPETDLGNVIPLPPRRPDNLSLGDPASEPDSEPMRATGTHGLGTPVPLFGQRWPGNPDGAFTGDPRSLSADVGGMGVPAFARPTTPPASPYAMNGGDGAMETIDRNVRGSLGMPLAPGWSTDGPMGAARLAPLPTRELAGPSPSIGYGADQPALDPTTIRAPRPGAPLGGGSPFDRAMNRTFEFEGGLNRRDTNGTPSNFGINQAANPDVDVLNLTRPHAKELYRARYWNTIGGDDIASKNPALAHVAFDTSVISGPTRAKQFLEASGGDASKFMSLREGYLNGLLASNPAKYGMYAKAWGNRNAQLRADIGEGGIATGGGAGGDGGRALAYTGGDGSPAATGSLGDGAAPRGGPLSLGSPAARASSAPANDNGNSTLGNALGINISPQLQQALLAGLFGMLGSKSTTFLGALGEGGLQGMGAYRNSLEQDRHFRSTESEIANRTGMLDIHRSELGMKQRESERRLKAAQAAADALRDPALPGAPAVPTPLDPASPPSLSAAPVAGAPQPQGRSGASAGAPPAQAAPVASSAPPARDPLESFWANVHPQSNPAFLDQRATQFERAAMAAVDSPETQKSYLDMAAKQREAARAIRQSGLVTLRNGSTGVIPGHSEAKAGMVGAEARARTEAENAGKPNVTPSGDKYVDVPGAVQTPQPALVAPAQRPDGGQPAPQGAPQGGQPAAPLRAPAPTQRPAVATVDPKTGALATAIPPAPAGGGYPMSDAPAGSKVIERGDANKELVKTDGEFSKEMLAKAPITDVAIDRYKSMAHAFKLFQSGATAERLAGWASIAESYGHPDIARKILGGDPAGVEWVEKSGVNLVLETLKAANPRFAQSEFNKLSDKGVPVPDKLPQTNFQMITEGLGQLERNKAFMRDWSEARAAGWKSPSEFWQAWSEKNPLPKFIESATRTVGNLKGMDLPAFDKWSTGTLYVAPMKMNPQQTTVLGRRGIKPGQMFRFDGKDVQPIPHEERFNAHLQH